MSFLTFTGHASVCEGDREGRRRQDDAALVCGSDCRALRKREGAEPGRDRDDCSVGREGRGRGRREGQARPGCVQRRMDDRQARHRRDDAEGYRDSGDRRHRSAERARLRAFRQGHVGEGRRSAAGQPEGRPSHEGLDPAAQFELDERRARGRAVQSAARSHWHRRTAAGGGIV